VVRFEPVPESGGYPCFPDNNPDRTIRSGSKPGPQPGYPEPLLTLLVTCLGVTVTCRRAPRITVEQSGKNNIFFGNAAGVPGNYSYWIQFVLSAMYLRNYIPTHQYTVYLDWLPALLVQFKVRLKIRIKWTQRYTRCRLLCDLRDGLGGRVRASLEMHWEAMMEWTQRCTWRL